MSASIDVLLCTYGDESWSKMAQEQALPSVLAAGFETATRVHLPEGSLAESRNRAAFYSTAEWLLFLDADDELGEGYREILEAAIEEYGYSYGQDQRSDLPEAVLLAPLLEDMHAPGVAIHPNRKRKIEDMNHCVIGTALPRWLFRAAGGFREWALYEDWELWLRCIRMGAIIEYIHAVYRADLSHGRNTPPQAERLAVYNAIRQEHLSYTSLRSEAF